jgi:hypothetical protein
MVLYGSMGHKIMKKTDIIDYIITLLGLAAAIFAVAQISIQ